MSDEFIQTLYGHLIKNLLPVFRASTSIQRYASNASLQNYPNPITAHGAKVYSQNDEDGITFEILRRLGISQGVFAEFGVGQGIENNTLALAARGWHGFWVGGEDLAFDFNPLRTPSLNFHFQKEWIKRSNILSLYQKGLEKIKESGCNLISLDLDGNDYYFVETLLLANVSPDVFIVEYNGKFIPPILFKIDYDDDHHCKHDDYFGASLTTFYELFKSKGYFLACCNITGINAFFVKDKYRKLFEDVPDEIGQLYASPKYFLLGLDVSGHPTSLKTIENIFRNLNSNS